MHLNVLNLGIGIELYDYPIISIQLNPSEFKMNEFKKDRQGNPKPDVTWDFKLKEWTWRSEFTDGKLSYLVAFDQNKKFRWQWGVKKEPAS